MPAILPALKVLAIARRLWDTERFSLAFPALTTLGPRPEYPSRVTAMATDDDFWLLLHDMANAVNHDHVLVSDKATTLAGYFKLYPPVARRQLTEEFKLVLGVLSELEAKVLVDVTPKAFQRDGHRGKRP